VPWYQSVFFFAVHIRHREVVVYPNDDAKPPLGQGLNRRAQVTLDRIYPTNKQTRAPIKDVDTIINMDYDTTLRKACYKMEARFIEYIPESGSWVFKVIPLIYFSQKKFRILFLITSTLSFTFLLKCSKLYEYPNIS
jgi:hypothetical protein